MRKDFDKKSHDVVSTAIGDVKDNEAYNCLLGTVVATAILGKIPSRKDCACLLGTCKTMYSRLLKDAIKYSWDHGNLKNWYASYSSSCPSVNAVIYSLAANLISQGYYIFDDQEPFVHKKVRRMLNRYFRPQAIQTLGTFKGYQITLEYLCWSANYPNMTDFSHFVKYRFDDSPSKAQEFCNLVSFFPGAELISRSSVTKLEKYQDVIHRLRVELQAM